MVYLINEWGYQGPIEKLLELVEEKKLEITTINLAKVTGDFLIYFQKVREEGDDVKPILADFLVVVSRLLLIKSKVLIPDLELTEEEEEDIRDLEFRLKIYKELGRAKRIIAGMWREKPLSVKREPFATEKPVFYPPKSINPDDLKETLKRMVALLEKTLIPKEKIKQEMVNLKDKIEHILKKITSIPLGLKTFHETGSRGELVVLFIAVLHLVKDNMLHVIQEGHFSEIHIAKKSSDG